MRAAFQQKRLALSDVLHVAGKRSAQTNEQPVCIMVDASVTTRRRSEQDPAVIPLCRCLNDGPCTNRARRLKMSKQPDQDCRTYPPCSRQALGRRKSFMTATMEILHLQNELATPCFQKKNLCCANTSVHTRTILDKRGH